ncbi:MAG: DEAD/DEAH box helicase, partial [Desulfurococcaceae archaeon]
MAERIYTDMVLRSKGYSFIKYTEPAMEPRYIDMVFKDIVEEFSSLELGYQRLYEHQYTAYRELSKGHNVVMVAGTGSGKTEAWFLYFASKLRQGDDIVAIAVYPTLALANDQVKRLEKYMSVFRKDVIQVDSVRKEEFIKLHGPRALRSAIASAKLIATNPAFLLHDMKRYFLRKESTVFSPIYHRVGLLVIDELDFYSPRSIALLLAMVQLLSAISDKGIQVVALSAGLSNPEDLCTYLEKTTGRPCNVIRGNPFRVENYVYIVLGKNLKEIWSNVKKLWTGIINKHPELSNLSNIVEDFEEFKSNAYYVLSVIEGLGYDVPSLWLDPAELISEYFKDKYVTIVFTRSISTAEELVRSIRAKYGQDVPIASHHHLV